MEREIIKNISVIIPSLNPDEKLSKTVDSLLSVGFTDIVCVNDGSSDECISNFPSPSENITLLTHEVNKGKGAALKTAFKYIKENRPDSIGAITVDGDGQHAALDVLNCADELIKKRDDIILGCRDFSKEDVPARSRFGNKLTSGVFKVFCGMKVSDTQTGLRAFPSKYYQDMLEISGDRFEYETNMLLEMKARKIPYSEVKIETVYIEENKTSHFRPVKDSFRIYSLIFKFSLGSFVKFLLSSVASFVIDTALIYLFLWLSAMFFDIDFAIQSKSKVLFTALSMILARLISSAFNFAVNRKFVFEANTPIIKDILKYYSVALPILALSLVLTSVLEGLAIFNSPIMITLLICSVNCCLYVLSYFLQKKWVFKK